tara:strand:- start:552 stop:4556 length:4005 start_codon:yes stop_codon:yes gene_type:complete
MTDKIIRGSGGPPPTPPAPYRAPDTLNSRQFATIQDLLSEGEIEGFATPSKAGLTRNTTAYNNAALKDIFLNDTPILREGADNSNPSAGDFAFQNVGFKVKFGTSNQTPMTGIVKEGGENTLAVGGTPSNPLGTDASAAANSVTKRVVNNNIDAVKVTITFPQLQEAKDNGDLIGAEVTLRIKVSYDGGSYTTKITDTVKGRSADSYSKQYRFDLDTFSTSCDVRVERVTKDSESESLKDEFRYTSLGEIEDTQQSYPNSAYTALRLDSEQFSSIPKRAFRIRGLKIKIPASNGTGTPTVVNNQAQATALGLGTVSSFGFIHYPANYVFDGQMGAAQWCSCPSMVLLDLLTSQRFGFGTQISPDQSTDAKRYENLDLFSFVAASRYANTLISNGFGHREPRFSCNVNIQSSKEAFDLIKDLATVMRCMTIWSSGSITISQDRPTDPSYLFSLSNVTPEGFNYTGSSLKQRNTVISVSYFNMESRQIDYEVVGDDVSGPNALQEDIDRQAKFGIVKKDIRAFACTSRGQARRLGKAILLSEESETEVVNFSTSLEAGAIVRPGAVINIQDPVRRGERRSGRITAATTTQITIDDALQNFGGVNMECSVILPDGSVESGTISNINGSVITVFNITRRDGSINNSSFTEAPNVNSIWLVQSDGVGEKPATYRVISIEEQDGINYSISAITYRAEKYSAIDNMQGITLPPRSISLLNQPKQPPTSISAEERVVVINALAVVKLIVSWQSVQGVTQYLLQYRYQGGNWTNVIVFRPDYEIIGTDAGLYEFKVFSYNAALKLSITSTDLSFNAIGKTAPPSDVENLSIEPVTNKFVRLRWDLSKDPDVIHGGRVYVRHSNKTDGSGTFQNSVDLIPALAGNTTEATLPNLEGEYILKFRDDQGNFSIGETSVILDLPDLIDEKVVLQDREDTDSSPFGGTRVRTSLVSGGLELTDPTSTITGTYSQSGKTVTITISNHGVIVGEKLDITYITGGSISGTFQVASVTNTNVFTVQAKDNRTITGNVSIAIGLRGTYSFANKIDLGGIFSLNLKRLMQSIGFAEGGQTITATYTQSGTTVQITSASHGRSVGNYIDFNSITGAGVDGIYQITAVTTNTFDFTSGTSQTVSSSNCTFAFVNTIDQLIPTGTFWDDYAPNGNFDGPEVNDVSANINVRTTNNDPASNSAIFSSFNRFANGTFKGRGFDFKVNIESENIAHNINIQQLAIIASFESRTELSHILSNGDISSEKITSSGTSSGTTVEFANPFFVGTSTLGGLDKFLPSIGITIQDAQSGDFFQLEHVNDANGLKGRKFNIKIMNGSTSNHVQRDFTFQAVGYGKGV